MSAHTPGPWKCTAAHWDGCEEGEVAYVIRMDGAHASAANARLISAAPGLLEVVIALLYEYEGAGYCASDELITRSRAAIVKATQP